MRQVSDRIPLAGSQNLLQAFTYTMSLDSSQVTTPTA